MNILLRVTATITIVTTFTCVTLHASDAQGPATLNAVDHEFIGLTYLGNMYQVDTGKLGETHASDKKVTAYAQLMDTSHVQVENKLLAVLGKLHVTQPPASLLENAYKSLVRMLGAEHGATFDRDYVAAQIDYQSANDRLYRWEIENGSNAALKNYAREVLRKIDDHKQQVEAIAQARM